MRSATRPLRRFFWNTLAILILPTTIYIFMLRQKLPDYTLFVRYSFVVWQEKP